MTLSTTAQIGTPTCERCHIPLLGYDAFFTHCNVCSETLLQSVEELKGYCSCHPGCGCQHPDECTNRHNP